MPDARTRQFFAQHFFLSWLEWIGNSPDSAAVALRGWLAAEERALRRAMEEFDSSRRPGDGSIRLLDAGTGFGRHVVGVLRRHPGWSAIAVDTDPSMLESARALAVDQGVSSRVRFFQCDMADLTAEIVGRVNCAMCVNVLGVLSRDAQAEFARRLFSVIRPRGEVVVTAYSLGSVAVRLRSYEAVGLSVQVSGDYIAAREGLRSQAFSSRSLSAPFIDAGFLPVAGVREYQNIGLVGQFRRPSD